MLSGFDAGDPSKNNDNDNNSENFWHRTEKKWVIFWDENKTNISDVEYSKKKFFITVAYPYPNSPQHIGHGRTYTLADVHARYHKLKGFNVLFPMGFHYTGTPILGMSKRVQSGDIEIIENFKNLYRIDENTITSFANPLNIAKYFHNEIKLGMIEMGYSIDWRREFTTIDALYRKFISWQFKKLREIGVIEQGSHPVGWCPNDENPVSQHDTLGDIEPSFTEYVFIKFKLTDEDVFIPVATLRPETIFGATNLWINPEETYLKVLVNNIETWLISEPASKKLGFQNFSITILSQIRGSEMIGRHVRNPQTNSMMPILPASFVTVNEGSGIVMSVPAHAPFDLQALIDIKKTGNAVLNEIDVSEIKPITIIDSSYDKIKPHNKQSTESRHESHSSIIPSQVFVNKYAIKDQNDPNLEKATSELYNLEFYGGKMNELTPLSGTSVSTAKEKIKQMLLESNKSIIFYELTNQPVFCRCGSMCYVKILNNQWFLNYGNKEWKALASKCLHQMDIIPNEIVGEFENVFEWLRERACARKSGLGTTLPWDKDWIVESLSDSVVYMIYYIIAKYVNTKDLENYESFIDGSFFDYVLYNKKDNHFGNIKDDGSIVISSGDGLKADNNEKAFLERFLNISNEIKKEFEYYYPLDSRHSGRDLVPNHLSFFIFNHAILFEPNLWPKQIVVNGSVLMEGKKMSKSMGNIIPLRSAIKQFSADSIRVAMLVLGELLQDVDFSFSVLKGIYTKLNDLYTFYSTFYDDNKSFMESMVGHDGKKSALDSVTLGLEDQWLLRRTKYYIKEISNSFDRLKIREALNTALYLMDKDFDWYEKRKHAKIGKLYQNETEVFIIHQFLTKRIKLLSPFCPFLSEELWHKYGNESSIFNSSWPTIEGELINDSVYEENEIFISNIISDLNKIIKVTKNASINKVYIYLSSEDKNHLYREILNILVSTNINKNFGEVMRVLLSKSDKDIEKQNIIKSNTDFIKKTLEDILSLTPVDRERRSNIGEFDEIKPLYDAISLLSKDYNVSPENILVYRERQKEIIDPANKSRFSRPFKPAIFIQ